MSPPPPSHQMLKEKVNRVKHTTIKHLGYSLTPPFPELQFPGPDFCGRSWELGLLNQRQRCCFREPVMGRMEGLGRRPGKSSVTLEDWSNQCERFFSGTWVETRSLGDCGKRCWGSGTSQSDCVLRLPPPSPGVPHQTSRSREPACGSQ